MRNVSNSTATASHKYNKGARYIIGNTETTTLSNRSISTATIQSILQYYNNTKYHKQQYSNSTKYHRQQTSYNTVVYRQQNINKTSQVSLDTMKAPLTKQQQQQQHKAIQQQQHSVFHIDNIPARLS